MIVYRYLSKEELTNILNNNLNKIGNVCYDKKYSNTHHYNKDIPYLHFFKYLKDIDKIQSIKHKANNLYLCKFNIPISKLIFHLGTGYYSAHGYDTDYETVREYAIPANKIKTEYLVSYIQDKSLNLTKEEAEKKFCNLNKTETHFNSL